MTSRIKQKMHTCYFMNYINVRIVATFFRNVLFDFVFLPPFPKKLIIRIIFFKELMNFQFSVLRNFQMSLKLLRTG